MQSLTCLCMVDPTQPQLSITILETAPLGAERKFFRRITHLSEKSSYLQGVAEVEALRTSAYGELLHRVCAEAIFIDTWTMQNGECKPETIC